MIRDMQHARCTRKPDMEDTMSGDACAEQASDQPCQRGCQSCTHRRVNACDLRACLVALTPHLVLVSSCTTSRREIGDGPLSVSRLARLPRLTVVKASRGRALSRNLRPHQGKPEGAITARRSCLPRDTSANPSTQHGEAMKISRVVEVAPA